MDNGIMLDLLTLFYNGGVCLDEALLEELQTSGKIPEDTTLSMLMSQLEEALNIAERHIW